MSERTEDPQGNEARLKALHCPRVDHQLELPEHERCPYCYGDGALIRRGNRADFCDFQPGVDPVRFGFPEGMSRDLFG